jgi:hypothetical protein
MRRSMTAKRQSVESAQFRRQCAGRRRNRAVLDAAGAGTTASSRRVRSSVRCSIWAALARDRGLTLSPSRVCERITRHAHVGVHRSRSSNVDPPQELHASTDTHGLVCLSTKEDAAPPFANALSALASASGSTVMRTKPGAGKEHLRFRDGEGRRVERVRLPRAH